ncbi:MAG: stage III sporulation protein AA [bacterium]
MYNNILNNLPGNIRNIVKKINFSLNNILEIRLRVNQPLQIIGYQNDFFISKKGAVTDNYNQAYKIKKSDLKEAMLILTENSKYALERQMREGFITIKGGHRVGFTGKIIYEKNRIKTIKHINSINYRITREVIGAAEKVIDKLYDIQRDIVYNTLIISPPLAGKTTLLRDIIRILSKGNHKIPGKKIGVVDERSELAGAYKGISQNDLGYRTDVLDNCNKNEGMMLLVRSMSPDVIAVDEIGKKSNIKAIEEVINSGVTLITTIHGNSLKSIKSKPGMKNIIKNQFFERYIILSKKKEIGEIKKVLNTDYKEVTSVGV